ncbi:MAG: hypothetical protein ACOYOA_14840, partial [Saprospiraceae bacterium]
MFRFFILLSFLLSISALNAQTRIDKFSTEKGEFIKQMEDFVTVSKTPEMEDVYSNFKKQWKSESFPENESVRIIELCNEMLTQKLTPNPFFKDYLRTLTVIKKGEFGEGRFMRWHELLSAMLKDIEKRKLTPIQTFLSFSFDFFDKNALRLSDGGTIWMAKSDVFELKYEGKIPFVEYNKLDLVCKNKKDSIFIYNTAGKYYPLEQVFRGKAGKAQWDRFGMKEVYYQFAGEYAIEMKKGGYEIDKGTLHYATMFPDADVNGTFEDKLVTENRNEASYPRFRSAEAVLKIKNLGQGVEFIGGFRLEGTTVRGYGSKKVKAQINILDEKNNLKFKAIAEGFAIRKGELVAGERVQSVIYIGTDSIFHPSVNFKFDVVKRELHLSRGERGSDRNPFSDSFHKSLIDSNNLDWYLDKDSIVIGEKKFSLSTIANKVQLESFKYYDDLEYRKLQSIGSTNPVAILKLLAERERSMDIDATVVAKALNPNFDIQSINTLLYDLVSKGFIDYDADRERVIIKDKVMHYANASLKKVDFDALKIVSETDKSNMSFNLKDKKMSMQGVNSLQFSTRQRVGILPNNDKLIMKENRDMDLDGRLYAGFGVMTGKGYHFDYNKFQIDMDSVKFFDLFIPTGDKTPEGEPIAKGINSRIENASGVILIDAPNNKSGRDDILMFPSFQSKGNAYVYYDDKHIMKGVYKRDSFSFILDKFSFNHMDNYVKDDIQFKGTMNSANIFPLFPETISIQSDTSLGFINTTPADGYPAYTGKGNYKGQIFLSNAGFLGKGQVNYLGAEINSEDIIFKPKQLLASAKKFDLTEDRESAIQVPQVLGTDVNIDWRPYKDSMYVTTKEKPFDIFKAGDHTLKGMLILTPKGVKGRGVFDWSKGTMTSKLLSFGANFTQADTMDMKIKVLGEDAFAFDTRNIRGKADFDEQIGKFKANTDQISTSMPYNKYQTSMSEFIWDMKNETVDFKTDKDKLATFQSTDPAQDSLNFKGKSAFYNLKTYALKIGGVPFIQTCDAFVYTEKGDVDIQPGGIMSTLENARIVADTTNKYHEINRATVDIKGRKNYTASGYYDYPIGNKKQEILFSDIVGARVGKGQSSEKKTETRATGEVEEKDSFLIDYKIDYRGKISLFAASKNLKFEGFASLNAPKLPYKEWFSINCDADKKDFAILFNDPKNYAGEPVRTGIYLSKETSIAYPSVMMPLFARKDRPLIDTRGLLKYNNKTDQFLFGDSSKVNAPQKVRRGNLLTLQNASGKVNFEGKFNICKGAKALNIDAAGRGEAIFAAPASDSMSLQNVDNKTFVDLMTGIDMLIPEKLLNVVANDLLVTGLEAQEVDYAKDVVFYEKALSEIISDDNEWSKMILGLKENSLEIPKKLNKYPLLFSWIPMKWNPDYQSLISMRDLNGLASIKGEKVNKLLTSFIEFKMPGNEDDRVYIYLKTTSDTYYFFGYQRGALNMVSNNPRFMEVLAGLKKDEKQKKVGDITVEMQAVESAS